MKTLQFPVPYVLLTLLFTAWASGSFAQQESGQKNLVPNGSFEEVSKEPTTYDQLDRAVGWRNATLGMAELFGKGANVKTVGIPQNAYGSMEPLDGERYAGFMAWKDDQRRDFDRGPEDPFKPGWNAYSEYSWIELPKPLVEGHAYELSFHVALAANSDRAVAGIGAHFSEIELNYPNRAFLTERPQVVEEKILEERGKWVEVKGRFVADGDERYLIIGTFPTAIFETKRIIERADNQYAYYYLDKVELRDLGTGKEVD